MTPLLTQQMGIVSAERKGTSPTPGHMLVVFELVNNGLQFVEIVADGTLFAPRKKSLFRAPPEYASYAVRSDASINHDFVERFTHKAIKHVFDLEFSISFRVSDAKTVVQFLHSDPLKRVRDHIKRIVGGAACATPWEELLAAHAVDNCRALHETVVKSAWPNLTAFANSVGIEVLEVHCSLHASAQDAEPLIVAGKKELEIEIALIEQQTAIKRKHLESEMDLLDVQKGYRAEEHKLDLELAISTKRQQLALMKQEHENELNRLKRIDAYQSKMLDATVTAIGTLAHSITHPDDFVRVAEAVRWTLQQVGFGGLGVRSTLPNSGVAVRALLPAGGVRKLGEILNEALDQFGTDVEQSPEKRELLSAVLHLIAELYMGALGNPEVIRQLGALIEDLSIKYKGGLSSGQFRFIQRTLDFEFMKHHFETPIPKLLNVPAADPQQQLRLHYVRLVDKKHNGGLTPEEELEKDRLAAALEEADAALYEPMKVALRAERDRLLRETGVQKEEG